MNDMQFTAEMTVEQALGVSHSISGVFLSHRTACVGCYLARFCTLRDVSSTYKLPLAPFLEELQRSSLGNPTNELGAKDEESD
jgi:hypothetical protein